MRISPVPIPIPKKNSGRRPRHKYPLHKLRLDGRPLTMRYNRTVHQTLYRVIKSFRKRNRGSKFVMRSSAQQKFIRVWRTA